MNDYFTRLSAATALLLVLVQSSHASEGDAGHHVVTFAGGCFWCMEQVFEEIDGVESVTSGYTGGSTQNPSYLQVSSGTTGHTEAIQFKYDPNKISYEELLRVFWRNIDPTVADRQFCDVGSQYRPGVFYHNAEQQRLAEASREQIEKTKTFPEPLVTEIVPASEFYVAEDYHQDYYLKNPLRYKLYKHGCGRDRRLKQLWGDTG